jgi:hypothetical protein
MTIHPLIELKQSQGRTIDKSDPDKTMIPA